MKLFLHIIWIVVLLFSWSCASSGEMHSPRDSHRDSNKVKKVQDPTLTLADYLRRFPGVQVSGYGNNVSVLIRGASSFIASTEPLYVIDGQTVGSSYSRVANSVSINDIDRIEVLKGSDAAIYGVRGGNGVILISTKGN